MTDRRLPTPRGWYDPFGRGCILAFVLVLAPVLLAAGAAARTPAKAVTCYAGAAVLLLLVYSGSPRERPPGHDAAHRALVLPYRRPRRLLTAAILGTLAAFLVAFLLATHESLWRLAAVVPGVVFPLVATVGRDRPVAVRLAQDGVTVVTSRGERRVAWGRRRGGHRRRPEDR